MRGWVSPAGGALRAALAREFPDDVGEWLAGPVQDGWLPPERRLARRRTLDGWNASPSAWFDWLRMQTALADLSHLSDSSPGYWKEFGYIARVCATGLLPERYWCPDGLPIATYDCNGDYPAHRRAMACTVLLICDDGAWDDGVLSIGVLLQSCLALDAEGRSRAESFVAWLVECADDASSAALLIALLLLRSMTAPDDPRLEVLAEELAVDVGHGDRVLAFVECLSNWGEQHVPPWSDVLFRRLSSPAVSPGVARLLEKLVTAWPKASSACP